MSLRSSILLLAAMAALTGCPSPPDAAPQGTPNAGAPGAKATPEAGREAPAKPGTPPTAGGPDAGGAPPSPGTPPAAKGSPGAGQSGPPPAPEDALGAFLPSTHDLPSFSKDLEAGDATVTLTFEISGATRGQIDIAVAGAGEPQVKHIEMFSDTSTVTITAPAKLSEALEASAMAYDDTGKIIGVSGTIPIKLAGEDASYTLTIGEGTEPRNPSPE